MFVPHDMHPTRVRFDTIWYDTISSGDDMLLIIPYRMRDAHHAGQARIERFWRGNINTYRYNTGRVFRADK